MKSNLIKTFLFALSAGFAGFVAGAGAMLIAFPFLFPPPEADDPLPEPASHVEMVSAAGGPSNRIARGSFAEDSPGRDPVHWANGEVGVYRSGGRIVLRLESNFVAGPGPNFIVYLNTRPVGDEKDFLADPGRRQVAGLRAFRGAQNYTLPAGLDLSQYRSVTIWCERFSEFIASAELPQGLGVSPGA